MVIDTVVEMEVMVEVGGEVVDKQKEVLDIIQEKMVVVVVQIDGQTTQAEEEVTIQVVEVVVDHIKIDIIEVVAEVQEL